MDTVLIIVAVSLFILLNYYIAKQFEYVAWEKGYTESKYFHMCFWLGLVGYLLVIALPVRSRVQSSSTSASKGTTTNENHVISGGSWSCKNCNTLNGISSEYCRVCGKNRPN